MNNFGIVSAVLLWMFSFTSLASIAFIGIIHTPADPEKAFHITLGVAGLCLFTSAYLIAIALKSLSKEVDE